MQYRVHLNFRQILNRVFPNIFGDNGGTCSEVYVELEVGKEYTPLKVSDFYFQWLSLIGRYSILIIFIILFSMKKFLLEQYDIITNLIYDSDHLNHHEQTPNALKHSK